MMPSHVEPDNLMIPVVKEDRDVVRGRVNDHLKTSCEKESQILA